MKPIKWLILISVILMNSNCSKTPHTSKDREALFNYINDKTMKREAFSEIKNERLNFNPMKEMEKYHQEMINAEQDQTLFNVLIKISIHGVAVNVFADKFEFDMGRIYCSVCRGVLLNFKINRCRKLF